MKTRSAVVLLEGNAVCCANKLAGRTIVVYSPTSRRERHFKLPDYTFVVTPLDYQIVGAYTDYDLVVSGGAMEFRGKVASPKSLGRILQQARLLNGLSQRELAERLNTSQRYIWEIEAGKPSIFVDRLFALMRETGVELTATIKAPDDRG